MIRRLQSVTVACLLSLATFSTPLKGQGTLPEWGRPLTPAEARDLRAEIQRLSTRLHVRETTLTAIARLVAVSFRTVGFDDLIQRIQSQAERAAELQTRLTQLQAKVARLGEDGIRNAATAALIRAKQAFDEGRLDVADRELATLESLRASETEAAREAWLDAVEARATIAELRFDYDRAESLRIAAAREERRLSARRQWDLMLAAAMSRYRQGELLGDNSALLRSIQLYRTEALPLVPRSESPDDWATTQAALGVALTALGQRERDTARLEDAVAVYRLCLEVWTRSNAPQEWANVQSNLGDTLQRLGERSRETHLLEQAVSAYRAALEVSTREADPGDWSIAQNNLGNALVQLGQREQGSGRFEEAVAAFRASLLETSIERTPLQWAIRQSNLGDALKQLGNRLQSLAPLEESVVAYRAALTAFSRERAPLFWARTQNGLGGALATLGTGQNRLDRLQEAIGAFRLALEEQRRETVPLEWAETTLNLALVTGQMATRSRDLSQLDAAIASARQAQALVIEFRHEPLQGWAERVLTTLERIHSDLVGSR